ncbi:SNF2 family N-terminal domain-domain-containing protein [Catenaria anguillulae PL171]|uniref:SNF2 family N-terminal domain-domain-containing protein n=1 Tax=Catenaria anguillulae PL171 TaxID=765915 RepID=A0A1Y2HE29_9FUNG|nr:SNF2 family N-terminal domain-domain-containing protein [Catenaria anguillulae PL171]
MHSFTPLEFLEQSASHHICFRNMSLLRRSARSASKAAASRLAPVDSTSDSSWSGSGSDVDMIDIDSDGSEPASAADFGDDSEEQDAPPSRRGGARRAKMAQPLPSAAPGWKGKAKARGPPQDTSGQIPTSRNGRNKVTVEVPTLKSNGSQPASRASSASSMQVDIVNDSQDEDEAVVPTKVDKRGRSVKRARTSRAASPSLSSGSDFIVDDDSDELASDDEDDVGSVLSYTKTLGKAGSSVASSGVSTPAISIDDLSDDDEDELVVPASSRASSTARGQERKRTYRPPAKEDPATKGMSKQEKRAYNLQQKVLRSHPELEGIWDRIPQRGPPPPVPSPEHLKLKLLPYQLEGLAWLVRQEQEELGILLADEMGMGKTISMIALMLSHRRTPTLIVAPTVAIKQWTQEMDAHIAPAGKFSVLLFHGQKRSNDENELLKYDIVITSYAVIESAFRKQTYGFKRKAGTVKEPSALHQIEWERIILDEAHSIKDRSTNTARAVFALSSKLKCALSGTPVQNRVGEMYSLIRYMQIDNFSHYFCRECPCKSLSWKFKDGRHCDDCGHIPQQHFCFWNYEILKPIQEHGPVGPGLEAFQKLGKLLDLIMLRRTKLEKADDLGLPPRHVVVRRDYFSQDERDFYSSLYSDSKRTFATYVAEGTVLNHYANIFELITRMRQAANHPCMVTSKFATAAGTSSMSVVCGICHEAAEDAVMAKCKHSFCREDVRQYIEGYGYGTDVKCPVCFTKLVVDLDADAVEVTMAATQAKATQGSIVSKLDMDHWRSSTKIEALVEELTRLQRQDHTIKSIVFSQFTQFLELIAWRLRRAGFSLVRLDGRMSIDQRDAAVKTFMTNPHVTVFLASQVFLMDPWWNSAVQDQAIDRIHRLGQYRPIRITHIIIEDSIEERIIQLQDKKRALFESTVGKDSSALARLSEDDLKFLFVM